MQNPISQKKHTEQCQRSHRGKVWFKHGLNRAYMFQNKNVHLEEKSQENKLFMLRFHLRELYYIAKSIVLFFVSCLPFQILFTKKKKKMVSLSGGPIYSLIIIAFNIPVLLTCSHACILSVSVVKKLSEEVNLNRDKGLYLHRIWLKRIKISWR